MVTLLLDASRLDVVLSATERALGFRRRDIVVERSAITRVQLTDDPWTWLRGVPDPGTYLPVAVAAGSWKSAGGRDFVVIRRRKPSVVIDLEGDPEFQRLILTTRHGLALIRALRLEVGEEPVDVVDIAPERTRPPARAPRPAPAAG